MGRGRGGGGGGGGGGSVGGARLFGIGGPAPDTKVILRRLAIAKGLRDADELLVKLGKKDDYVSYKEAIVMLRDELGSDAVIDQLSSMHYGRGKGYYNCNYTLDRYLKSINDTHTWTRGYRDLIKYCGYTKDELELLTQSS
ncbi:hypothetical protein KSS87_000085 [Heliosperma pusillum]|nr:hypothetical protein KSS87_000085 [Heliosperma pusillum]